ncbi:hypothetical protein F2P79_020381 [Pimephales promelas]|nr:hypothetical protein F2P79_020381 [Pimephales promelas]
MANISDACLTLPLSAGEDTFELFTVKQELEYVDKQIRGLLDVITSGFIHSGTETDPGCTVQMDSIPAESERLCCRTTSPRRYAPDD